MKKKCRLTYKRIIPRYYGRNTDETVAKRRDAVAYWVSQNIDFMNECVFLDEAGSNRSMHRSLDGLRLEHLAKLMFKRREQMSASWVLFVKVV